MKLGQAQSRILALKELTKRREQLKRRKNV